MLTAEIEANALIEDLNAALEKCNSQSSKSKAVEEGTADDDAKGKGKERESSPASPADDDAEGKGKEGKSSSGPPEDDDSAKRSGIANRIREAELLLHKVTFLMGDMYHTLGAKYSRDEESSYAKAELIRKKLLKGESHTPCRIVLR